MENFVSKIIIVFAKILNALHKTIIIFQINIYNKMYRTSKKYYAVLKNAKKKFKIFLDYLIIQNKNVNLSMRDAQQTNVSRNI